MPELPEVETTCRGIAPHIEGQDLQGMIVRQPRLRWPVSDALLQLEPQRVLAITRRAKYILMTLEKGVIILHLGMSGSLRWVDASQPVRKHDHIDFIFGDAGCLRFNDPRRFGCCLWQPAGAGMHPLLAQLGVEPLTRHFNGKWLHQQMRKRQTAIKSVLMDHHLVVGVGNIYATEALFIARIHPQRSASTLTLEECENLVKIIKKILKQAIELGGTTLRDFINPQGKPGYFQQSLWVYGRAGQPCHACQRELSLVTISQRSTVFCAWCQR